MNFGWSTEDEDLRRSIRSFLDESLTGARPIIAPLFDPDWEAAREFVRRLVKVGWVAPAWPPEWGGLGLKHIQRAIFAEEFARAGAPDGGRNSGVEFLGPVLMRYGTQDQKARFLPGISGGKDIWCQGFSEPGSGSDLASLKSTAERVPGGFSLNGQKIWTSHALEANWCFALARTDREAPKHHGISLFVLPMDSAGITIQPLTNLLGVKYFAQVFFSDVFVPESNLVGGLNQGWEVATTLLNFERASTGSSATALRLIEGYAHLIRCDLAISAALRFELADLFISANVSLQLAYMVAWSLDRGESPTRQASVAKLFATELVQRACRFGSAYLGLKGQVLQGPLDTVGFNYLRSTALTIAGGTSEIQRSIIGRSVIGLPKVGRTPPE